jgi:hypothetical protein
MGINRVHMWHLEIRIPFFEVRGGIGKVESGDSAAGCASAEREGEDGLE